jgi:hypothetical protein
MIARDEVATILSDTQTAAAGVITSTFASAAGKRNFICGFDITGLGATAATFVEATLAGLGTTMKFGVVVPAGATVGITPVRVTFPWPMPASADATAITLSVPSFGSGNTKAVASMWGFQA